MLEVLTIVSKVHSVIHCVQVVGASYVFFLMTERTTQLFEFFCTTTQLRHVCRHISVAVEEAELLKQCSVPPEKC